jgi:hypothetical protein
MIARPVCRSVEGYKNAGVNSRASYAGGVTLLPIIDRIRKEIDLEGIIMVLCE